MENDQELIEQPKSKSPPEIPKDTIKLDIFQHIKIGLNNKDINCQCENSLENLYYCIPCKLSCCQKCTFPEHTTHLLLQKEKYTLKPNQINDSINNRKNNKNTTNNCTNMCQKMQIIPF